MRAECRASEPDARAQSQADARAKRCRPTCLPWPTLAAYVCGATAGGRELASEFSQLVNSAGIASPLANRRPSHMLPPNAVVSAQLEALQRNDWPEPDAGVRAAFAFAKPLHAEDLTPLVGAAALVPCGVVRAAFASLPLLT